jgi:hypothetical protein
MVAGIAATPAVGALTADAVHVIHPDWTRYPPCVAFWGIKDPAKVNAQGSLLSRNGQTEQALGDVDT